MVVRQFVKWLFWSLLLPPLPDSLVLTRVSVISKHQQKLAERLVKDSKTKKIQTPWYLLFNIRNELAIGFPMSVRTWYVHHFCPSNIKGMISNYAFLESAPRMYLCRGNTEAKLPQQ